MRQSKQQPNNLILVGIFAVVVLFLIVISLVIKFFGVWQESTFDGSHRYTIAIFDPEKHVVYLTVDPSQGQKGKLIVENATTAEDTLRQIPLAVDGFIVLSTEFDPTVSVTALIQTALIKRNDVRYNLTFIDLIRMYVAAKTTFDSTREHMSISLPFDDSDSSTIEGEFTDKAIIDEGLTVSIENATSISGLGGRLEDVLRSLGVEVLSVETAVSSSATSEITYFGEPSYTLSKIETILGYPSQVSEDIGISDISIIIGEDGLTNTVFQIINTDLDEL